MSRVYIPHLYVKYDPITRQNVASIDLTEAQQYGELVPVTSGEIHLPTALEVLWTAIDTSYEDGDYVLAIGDPLMIGAALSYAAEKVAGPINVLRWDRNHKEYDVVEFEL